MRNRGFQPGFSLLECLAAIVILGSSLVAGLSLLGFHEQMTMANEATRKAHVFLDREIERIHATPFPALKTTSYAPLPENSAYQMRRVTQSIDADTKAVTIDVLWTTPWGLSRTDTVSTLSCRGVR